MSFNFIKKKLQSKPIDDQAKYREKLFIAILKHNYTFQFCRTSRK